jgi:precorrin-3B synthase
MTAVSVDTLAKGWCPGVLRPMESGDGLIVRLKITGGIVSAGLAADIAGWSARWGNGKIDLTGRANLQLRGLSPRHLPRLRDAMADWGLLDISPEAEAVRNVMASPLAGVDPHAAFDIRGVVERLESRLVHDPSLHALPAKFGFAIDDGGRFPLGDSRADIRFEARDGPLFDIVFDGAPGISLGPCLPDSVADVAARIASAFISARAVEPFIRRMRDWTSLAGVDAIAETLGLGSAPRRQPRSSRETPFIGVDDIGLGRVCVGIGLPFGAFAAKDLRHLAHAVDRLGGHEIRLTPWRSVLVPLASAADAHSLLLSMQEETSFIVDAANPLLRVAACVGAPACARATTDVRGDAAQLAPRVPNGRMLHVSGCGKGCAHPKSAAVTLVGREGRYDLVRGGAAGDAPLRENLTLADAEHLLFSVEMGA